MFIYKSNSGFYAWSPSPALSLERMTLSWTVERKWERKFTEKVGGGHMRLMQIFVLDTLPCGKCSKWWDHVIYCIFKIICNVNLYEFDVAFVF